MSDMVRIGDAIVDRAHLRAGLLARLSQSRPAMGRWDGPLFRFTRPNGGILAVAAIYRGPNCRILFLWLGHRLFSWHLGCPAVSYTGPGKWSW